MVPGAGKPTILLGDMNTPEQFILGQLYRLALRAQGYTVSLSRNVGPTSISVEAMKEHSLDIYPGIPERLGHERGRRSPVPAIAPRRLPRRPGLRVAPEGDAACSDTVQ